MRQLGETPNIFPTEFNHQGQRQTHLSTFVARLNTLKSVLHKRSKMNSFYIWSVNKM